MLRAHFPSQLVHEGLLPITFPDYLMNKTNVESPTDAPDSDSADRSVKPFELFFDLVFFFAFTQVIQLLASELSWVGLGQGLLLIVALWLAWQSYA